MSTPALAHNVRGRGRHYTHPVDGEDVPSITNIIGVLDKPAARTPVHYNGVAGRRTNAPGRGHPRLDGDDMTDATCACGCGQPTRLATRTRPQRGQVKGQPLRYLLGHNSYELPPLADRFYARVEKLPTGCWKWTGSTTSDGIYPRLCVAKTAYVPAHRWSYEHHVGPIPDGLTIDHLCRFTLCVNPEHLEPVTNVENVMRGEGACARNARKTHCKRGHEFTVENTYVKKNGGRQNSGRQCKTCTLEAAR